MQYSALVLAAGNGSRMKLGYNKIFYELSDGRTVLDHALEIFREDERCKQIVLVCNANDVVRISSQYVSGKVVVVLGGKTRQESVYNGLKAVHEDNVLIHDGARPLVRPEMIDEMIRAGWQTQAAAPSTPVTDTVKVADDDRGVASTPERSTLYAVQTPQVFQANILKAALQAALASGEPVTDDCAAVERLGKRVWLAEGDVENIKITTPVDLIIVEALLRQREDGR